jgi:hypothetical protein
MNYDNYYKNGGMTKEESVSAIALRIGAKKEAVAKFVEKNNIDTNKLNSDLKSGQVYFLDVITAIVGKPNNKYEKEIVKKYGNKMAMGGKTQGYDDREDERLGMDYGKISGKDFDGSHDMREHSRRDDARFEERMARGGKIDEKEKLSNISYQLINTTESFKKNNPEAYSKMRDEYKAQFIKVYGKDEYAKRHIMADGGMMADGGEIEAKKRLEELREELRSETISYGELFELQSLVEYIDKDDVELLEAAGVPEFDDDEFKHGGMMADGGEIEAKKRLEELREELRSETISYGELFELQSLVEYIDKDDVELLEAAGVPEFDDDEFKHGGMMDNEDYDDEISEEMQKLLEEHEKEAKKNRVKITNLGSNSGDDYIASKTTQRKDGSDFLTSEINEGEVTHYWEEYAQGGVMDDGGMMAGIMAKGGKVSYREAGENYEYVNTFGIEQRDFEKIVDAYHKSPSSDQIDRIDSRMTFNEMRTKYGIEKVDEVGNYIHKTHQSHGKMADGGMMAKGGLLEEGDYVWNAVGKKLVVNKVTDDEYFLSAFGQIGDSPFSKQKVEMYLKNGQWSRKPKMAKGGREMSGRNDVAQVLEKLNTDDDKQDATKNKWEYTDKDEIEYVVVKDKSGKELKFDGKYVISGVHDLLEKGGKLTEIGKYYSKNDVVSVFVNGKNILDKNTVSGVWIDKNAKSMAEGGDVDEIKMDKNNTTIRKGFHGWIAKTIIENFKGYDWDISTLKTYDGDLTSTAQAGDNKFYNGYTSFEFVVFQDPSIRLKTSRPARVNEKAVLEQHAEALKIFKEKVGNTPDKEKMADGGAIGFDALAKKVADNYEGNKVKKKFQDEYGKTYDKTEAEEVGKKVAGKVYRQQQAKGKMAKGGKVAKKTRTNYTRSENKMTLISRKASEIRKANEPWKDAFNRAKAIIG